jgi:hypothetical protein
VETVLSLRAGGAIAGSLQPPYVDDSQLIRIYGLEDNDEWVEGVIDKGGRFLFSKLIPQAYVVECVRRSSDDPGEGVTMRRTVLVNDGETATVEFDKELESIVAYGAVLGLDNEADYELEIRRANEGGGWLLAHKLQLDGLFSARLPSSGEYLFSVIADSGSFSVFRVRIGDEGASALSLRLPSGSVVGRLTSLDGKSVANVPVTLTRDIDQSESGPTSIRGRYRHTRADETGTFRFAWLEPGSYTLRAPDGNFTDLQDDSIPLGMARISGVIIEDQKEEKVTLVLGPEGDVVGRVVDSAGIPLPDAHIVVRNAANQELWALTGPVSDENGVFKIRSLAPGAYTVYANWNGKKSSTQTMNVEAEQTSGLVLKVAR